MSHLFIDPIIFYSIIIALIFVVINLTDKQALKFLKFAIALIIFGLSFYFAGVYSG